MNYIYCDPLSKNPNMFAQAYAMRERNLKIFVKLYMLPKNYACIYQASTWSSKAQIN